MNNNIIINIRLSNKSQSSFIRPELPPTFEILSPICLPTAILRPVFVHAPNPPFTILSYVFYKFIYLSNTISILFVFIYYVLFIMFYLYLDPNGTLFFCLIRRHNIIYPVNFLWKARNHALNKFLVFL
jgi:hypothetical protein